MFVEMEPQRPVSGRQRHPSPGHRFKPKSLCLLVPTPFVERFTEISELHQGVEMVITEDAAAAFQGIPEVDDGFEFPVRSPKFNVRVLVAKSKMRDHEEKGLSRPGIVIGQSTFFYWNGRFLETRFRCRQVLDRELALLGAAIPQLHRR